MALISYNLNAQIGTRSFGSCVSRKKSQVTLVMRIKFYWRYFVADWNNNGLVHFIINHIYIYRRETPFYIVQVIFQPLLTPFHSNDFDRRLSQKVQSNLSLTLSFYAKCSYQLLTHKTLISSLFLLQTKSILKFNYP